MTTEPQERAFEKVASGVAALIASFDKKRALWRKWDLAIWLSQAILAALTTILAGFSTANEDIRFRIATLVSSALITFLTAVATQLGARQRWIAFTKASTRLRALRTQLDVIRELTGAERTEQMTAVAVDRLRGDMQAILDEADAKWSEIVTPRDVPAKTSPGR